jgi:glycerol-3-phosphate acyltransferase PlsY
MDWTKEASPRLLATAYVVGFVAWLIGVLWILYNQFTGGSAAAMIVGIILFAIGQALISIVAFTLRHNFQTASSTSSFSQAWQRLSTGLELAPALRLLLNR